MATIQLNIKPKDKLQSPFLFLDAAGSRGIEKDAPEAPNKITKGIHLRWSLMGALGKNHIPKGALGNLNAYAGNNSLNKSGADYFKVYRAPFVASPVILDLKQSPVKVSESHDNPFWEYQVGTRRVFIKFLMSQTDYNNAGGNNSSNRVVFVQSFTGEIEVEVDNEFYFGIGLTIETGDLPLNTPEYSISQFSQIGDELLQSERQDTNVMSSYTMHHNDPLDQYDDTREYASDNHFQENIRFSRLSWNHGKLISIQFHVFNKFIEDSDWVKLEDHDNGNGFSLSNSWTVVNKRLKGVSGSEYELSSWPRFTKQYLTDVNAYEQRFYDNSNTYDYDNYNGVKSPLLTDHIAHVLHKYLEATKDGIEDTSYEHDPSDPGASMGLRYTDLLNTASVDFHIARMLGMGHIDKFTETDGPVFGSVNDDELFVYLLEYTTPYGNDQNDGKAVKHYYMCPPISFEIEKEPGRFEMTVEKGVKSSNNNSLIITDEEGYSKYEKARYIGLLRNVTPDVELLNIDPTFEPLNGFSKWMNSVSVMYHLESNLKGTFEVIDYLHDGVEVTPTVAKVLPYEDVANANLRIHIHKIEEFSPNPNHPIISGHAFQGVGINWFMRPSGLSNNQPSIDDTEFSEVFGLMPPNNFHAHYIQQETTRVFTTLYEQNNHVGDLRLTFEWNAIHHHMAREASSTPQINFVFRKNLPSVVKGAIASIDSSSVDEDELLVTTEGYSNKSVNPIENFAPSIDASDSSKFLGGVLIVDGEQFFVKEITQSGSNPTLKIKRILDRIAHQPETKADYRILDAYRDPRVGARFTLVENLNTVSEWDQVINQTVSIDSFDSTYYEQVQESDGTVTKFYYDGINDTAIVEKLPDNDGINDDNFEGLYRITLNNPSNHPIANSNWYKGTIRVTLSSDPLKKKELEVVRFTLDPSQRVLQIEAFDSDYNGEDLAIGSSVNVNFHPGYRVYIPLESSPSEFTEASVEPMLGEEMRKTLVSCWTSVGNSVSSMAIPSPIFAVEQHTPLAPQLGNFPVYATRPDVDGKSSFTFDIEVQDDSIRRPYGFIFYRCNDRSLLDALYQEDTAQAIYTSLKNNGEIVPLNARWQGLITTDVDGATNDYLDYGSGYAFPRPDHADIDSTGNTAPGTISGILNDIIVESFTPLTEEPVLYSELASDRMHTLKRATNERFPMAIKYTESGSNKKMVRFTDYTLDGASTNFYFYFAVEVTPDFRISDPSPALGPINLVNSLPPDSPRVKKVLTKTQDDNVGTLPSVSFEIEPYLESEGIDKIRLFRTTEPVYANSVRLMDEVADIDVNGNLIDEFHDLAFPPFGDPIFYKLVGLREIKNEQGVTEYVPSVASKTQLASVVDVINPEAPDIVFTFDPASPNGQFDSVVLTWNKAAHNATYTLNQMNDQGNWVNVYSIKDNAQTIQFPPTITDPADQNFGQPDFGNYPEMASLVKDDNGTTIYYRFKVSVENASGLFNLDDKVLII